MKTVNIKNHKKELFQRDFRLKVFYSVFWGGSPMSRDMLDDFYSGFGFVKDSDDYYRNQEHKVDLLIKDNVFAICFDPSFGHSEARLPLVLDVTNSFVKRFNAEIKALSITHLNRFVISDFDDNDNNRSKALHYFFNQEFASEDDLLCQDNGLIALSKLRFLAVNDRVVNLDFQVTAGESINQSNPIVEDSFSRIENLAYRFWRSAVSKNVLNEMRRRADE